MEDNILMIVKGIICVIVFGLAVWAFMRDEFIIGLLAFVVFLFFVWFLFLRNMVSRDPLALHVMIQMSLEYLEDHFKKTPGRSRDFTLYQHQPYGKTEYKLMFVNHDEDTGQDIYYPVTIDRYSGLFGEGTGTEIKSIVEATYFFNKGTSAQSSRPVTVEDLQTLFEGQRNDLNPQEPKQGSDLNAQR